MAEPAIIDSSEPRVRRAWMFLVLLVAGLTIANVIFRPSHATRANIWQLFWIGMGFCEPILCAVWAVLGPPPAVVRSALSLSSLTLIALASAFSLTKEDGGALLPFLLVQAGLFLASAVLAVILRRVTGWRIINTHKFTQSRSSSNQFSLRFLLVLTTICAVLLLLGRSIMATSTSSSWPPALGFASFVEHLGIVLCVAVPALVLPLMALMPRFSRLAFVATPLVWVALSSLAIEAIKATGGPSGDSRWDLARQVLLIQSGIAGTGVISALVVRLAGYRLINNWSATVS